MGQVTRGMALELQARFGLDTNWDELDGEFLQQQIIQLPREELGRRFTAFLRNGAQIVIGEPRIIKIDRSQPFDPAKFIGEGWTIWKGPFDGNGLEGEEQQDEKSLPLTEVDLTKVSFATMLKSKETYVNGVERQKRLRAAGHIRLDAQVFQTFWNNQALIPETYKRMPDGSIRYMYFDGTILRYPDGLRCVLCLCFGGDGWDWHVAASAATSVSAARPWCSQVSSWHLVSWLFGPLGLSPWTRGKKRRNTRAGVTAHGPYPLWMRAFSILKRLIDSF